MYRHASYSENNDWENMNQSQRGNSNYRQNQHYGNNQNRQGNRPQNRNDYEPYNQNREDAFEQGYGSRQENRRYQDNNFDFYYPEQSRNQRPDYRGAYRLDSEQNEPGYHRLHERNFGDDYGYGHSGNSRTGGDYGRSQSDYGSGSTYGASRNAGSMGSYGGAQGFGSATNGFTNEKWGSGHRGVQHQPHHTVYGAYRDKNSFAPGENETYDGSQRSGSQGADNTRGWTNPGRSGRYGSYRQSTSEEDSQYEIYDSALSQYNRGMYGHNTGASTSISDEPNLHSHQQYSPSQVYGSRERSRNRQGSGNDHDRYSGSGFGYQNLDNNWQGADDRRRQSGPDNRYFDRQTGNVIDPNAERNI